MNATSITQANNNDAAAAWRTVLLDLIGRGHAANMEEKRQPDNVPMPFLLEEAQKEMRGALNGLVADGILGWHSSVNGVLQFYLKNGNL